MRAASPDLLPAFLPLFWLLNMSVKAACARACVLDLTVSSVSSLVPTSPASQPIVFVSDRAHANKEIEHDGIRGERRKKPKVNDPVTLEQVCERLTPTWLIVTFDLHFWGTYGNETESSWGPITLKIYLL